MAKIISQFSWAHLLSCIFICNACSPTLQNAFPECLPNIIVPYENIPAEIKSQKTYDLVNYYKSISGNYTGNLWCPSSQQSQLDYPITLSGPVSLVLTTNLPGQIKVVVGTGKFADGATGRDCHQSGMPVIDGTISINGPTLHGINGQTVYLQTSQSIPNRAGFTFDSSFEPKLESASGIMETGIGEAPFFVLTFSFQPQLQPDGITHQMLYSCYISDLVKNGI